MKKFILVLLLTVMCLFGLTGCELIDTIRSKFDERVEAAVEITDIQTFTDSLETNLMEHNRVNKTRFVWDGWVVYTVSFIYDGEAHYINENGDLIVSEEPVSVKVLSANCDLIDIHLRTGKYDEDDDD